MDDRNWAPWRRRTIGGLIGGVLLVTIAASIAGWALDLYRDISWYDEVQHALSATLLAPLAIYVLPSGARDVVANTGGRLLVASVLLWMGGAALWELLEWAIDLVTGINLSKGYRDTLLDLVLGLGGGVLGTSLLVLVRPSSRP